jgi:hypothetical protein
LLVEQPVVKSWALIATFVEEVQVDESRDLTREKRSYTSLGIALDRLSVKDDRLGMVASTSGCNSRSLSR